MSDTFGLLQIPIPAPESDDETLADPALDILRVFIQSVVNFDCGAAWARRCPTDPIPITHTFSHAPNLEDFNSNDTPAIFLWRNDDNANASHKYSEDLVADESGVCGLWVPPPLAQEDMALIESFRNGMKKSLRQAFAQGRHEAWVVAGDDYYEPEVYGSVLLHHLKMAKCRFGQCRTHRLTIDAVDRSGRHAFDAVYFTIDTLELAQRDPLAHAGHGALNHVQGRVFLPDREIEETEDE